MSIHREMMSNVDTTWLRMEHPTNLMMITGILGFDTSIDYERLLKVVEARLMKYDRFRQRVIPAESRFGNPIWEDDPRFDLRNHLTRLSLPAPAGEAELQALINKKMSTPLDFSRPLWQFHLIENYDKGAVLLGRIHHCIADGTALVRVLLTLTDDTADESASGASRSSSDRTWKFGSKITGDSTTSPLHPSHLMELVKLGAEGAASLGKLALRRPDPRTLFKGPLGQEKQAVWSQPLPLDVVKATGKAVGATINDVLLSAMTGGLRRYLVYHQNNTHRLNIRAAVPVNLRPMNAEIQLGNHFGLVFPSLPVGIEEPLKRLRVLHKRMQELKAAPEAMVTFGALKAAAIAPTDLQRLIVDFLGQKFTAVMTNVPGPRERLFVAGAPMRQMMFWVPQSGRSSLGISILSYAGEVSLGVAADQSLVPDPGRIVEGFHEEFEALQAAVNAKLSK